MLTSDRKRTISIGGCKLEICEKIIPDSARANKNCASWCKRGQQMKPCRKLVGGVQGVTIHNTGDLANVKDDAECYTRATWPNCNMGGVVVHYYLDNESCWQNLDDLDQGWHAADGAGPGNTTTIAIEVIMDGKGGETDITTEERAAVLAAYLLKTYGLTINQLYTHNHWMGQPDRIVPGVRKNCPIYILPHWEQFREKVKKLMSGSVGTTTTQTLSNEKVVSYRVRVSTAALNIRKGPSSDCGTTGYIRDKGVYTIVAESKGTGSAKGWGKLKSGAGWISLDYCTKIGI